MLERVCRDGVGPIVADDRIYFAFPLSSYSREVRVPIDDRNLAILHLQNTLHITYHGRVCIDMCIHIRIYVCVCIFIRMYIYMYICVYICIYICKYIYIYVYACIYIYTYSRNTYTYMYIFSHAGLVSSTVVRGYGAVLSQS